MPMLTNNLKILQKDNPDLAGQIEMCSTAELTFTKTRTGERNLCDERSTTKQFFHSNYSIEKEIAKWFESLSPNLENIQVLFVYGIGLGYAYSHIKPWLQESPDHYLVVLEEDLPSLRKLLETEIGGQLVGDPQVTIVQIPGDKRNLEIVCQDLALHFVGLMPYITALPYYATAKSDHFSLLQTQLMHSFAYVGFTAKEFIDYGVAFYRNFYPNLLKIPSSRGCRHLVDAFQGVPAIICGAGPSLNKNLDLIKQYQDKAILFAGGSSMNALSSAGIQPHFGGSVDPNPLQAERMKSHKLDNTPTFFKGRTYYKALEAIESLSSPLVYLSGNNMYPLTLWIEEKLGIKEPQMTEGHNILHLMIDIATRFGCNPIIFVGIDLAFTGMQSYASGVIEDSAISQATITQASNINDNAFLRPDIHGEPVYTLWKWVAESQYTSEYARSHPNTRFFNATEGGLGFEGVPNIAFEEIAEKFLTKEPAINIAEKLEQGKFEGVDRAAILRVIDEIESSLVKCIGLTSEIAEELNALIKAFKSGDSPQIQSTSEKIEQKQAKLKEEIACKHILEPVNQIRSVIYERQWNQGERDRSVKSELDRMIARCEGNRQEILSLKECAEVNRGLLRAASKGV